MRNPWVISLALACSSMASTVPAAESAGLPSAQATESASLPSAEATESASPSSAQASREERALLRLARTVESVETALRQHGQMRAQMFVTEFARAADSEPGRRGVGQVRRGTLAYGPQMGVRMELSGAFPAITGTPPIEQIGFLVGDDAVSVLRFDGDDAREEPADAGPSDWRFVDILRAFEQVHTPGQR